jgi:glutathione synthase/RimK-type ligase-like ATP-grasp enzyme
MRIAILAGGDGWHVRDLIQASNTLGHQAEVVDFRKVYSGIATTSDSFAAYEAVIVRTMPPGSLEQVVFRMDALQRLQARGTRVLNPPRTLEMCVDKYLASATLEAAGLPVPPTVVCQDAESFCCSRHL